MEPEAPQPESAMSSQSKPQPAKTSQIKKQSQPESEEFALVVNDWFCTGPLGNKASIFFLRKDIFVLIRFYEAINRTRPHNGVQNTTNHNVVEVEVSVGTKLLP